MKIEQEKIENLIPYGFNNRIHSDEQIDRIANSIKEFGFNQPLVIDGSKIVIVGHGRLMAAKKLGLSTVPVVRKTDLTEAQIKAYRILDNKLQDDSEWELDNLQLELSNLEDLGFDLDVWNLRELGLNKDEVNVLETLPDIDDSDRDPFRQLTVTLHDEQFEEVEASLKRAKKLGHDQSSLNKNANGNALAFVCSFFNRRENER